MVDWPKDLNTFPNNKPLNSITLLHPGKIKLLNQILEAYKKSDNRTERLVWIYSFFDHAYHLKGWFKNFPIINDFEEVWKKYSDNEYFKICRDFCNKNKHIKVSQPSISNNVHLMETFENGKAEFFVTHNNKYMPSEFLMSKLLEFWQNFESQEI